MSVAAWSRPLDDARALEPHGVRVASTAWEAAGEADLVVTMAPDANAIEGFATGERGFLSATPAAVWAQCATVGLDGCERLSALAAEAGVAFVDSPCSAPRSRPSAASW